MKKNCIVIEVDFTGAGNQGDETITYTYPKPEPKEAYVFNPNPNIARLFYRAFHLLRNYTNAQKIKMPDSWDFYFSEPGNKEVRVSVWDIDGAGERNCLITLILDGDRILAAFGEFEHMILSLYHTKQDIVDFQAVRGSVTPYSKELLGLIAPTLEDEEHGSDSYQSIWLVLEDSDTLTVRGIEVNYYHDYNSYVYTGSNPVSVN